MKNSNRCLEVSKQRRKGQRETKETKKLSKLRLGAARGMDKMSPREWAEVVHYCESKEPPKGSDEIVERCKK